MVKVGAVLIFLVAFGRSSRQSGHFEKIKQLVTQWAPLIWMSPGETYYPSSVDTFFENVYLANQNQKLIMSVLNKEQFPVANTKSLFLVTMHNIEFLKTAKFSHLHGHNPTLHPVPIYAVISTCSNKTNPSGPKTQSSLFFTVTYWVFYPFNEGKKICFIGKVPSITIFGRCIGKLKTIGSHVGDWEHATLFFRGNPYPSEMYTAIHDGGGYYLYELHHNHFILDLKRSSKRVQGPKLPPIVKVQNGHPVLFSAEGSHGLWAAPGEHEYLKVPHLTDKCGYGVPWKTWENLEVLHLGSRNLPKWLFFKGKWGNPKSNCILTSKLGLCEYTDGPLGILRNQQEFFC